MEHLFTLKRWASLFESRNDFISGLWVTLQVAILGLILALLLGTIFGMFSSAKNTFLRAIARVYVEFFQNTPLLIQVFFYYNGLPYLGIVLNTFTIGIISIGLYHGAYISEVIRTGILSIPKGQSEAASSQGFNYIQMMIYIILPQTLKVILPPLANQALNLVRNTSVMAIIVGGDLMYHADSWATLYDYHIQGYLTAGILFFILCYPLSKLVAYLELRSKYAPAPLRDNKSAKEVA